MSLLSQYVIQLMLNAHRRSITSDEDRAMLARLTEDFVSIRLDRLPEDQYHVLQPHEEEYVSGDTASRGPSPPSSMDITPVPVPETPPANPIAEEVEDEEMLEDPLEEGSASAVSADGQADRVGSAPAVCAGGQADPEEESLVGW